MSFTEYIFVNEAENKVVVLKLSKNRQTVPFLKENGLNDLSTLNKISSILLFETEHSFFFNAFR